MQKLHRYTIDNIGIFMYINNHATFLTDDDQLRYNWIFERFLDDPFPDASDDNPAPKFTSYFTDAGYHKFRKQLRNIIKEMELHNVVVKHSILELRDEHDIVYRDKYQICLKEV